MKETVFCVTLLLFIFLGGCVAVPVPTFGIGNIDKEAIQSFQVGTTTRQEVLNTLGDPDLVLDDGRTLIFRGTYSDFAWIGMWQNQSLLPDETWVSRIGGEHFEVHVDFDDQDRIASIRSFEGKRDAPAVLSQGIQREESYRAQSWKATTTESAKDWSPSSVPRPALVNIREPDARFSQIAYSKITGTLIALGSEKVIIWPDAAESDFFTLSIPSVFPYPMALSADGTTLAVLVSVGSLLTAGLDIAIYDVPTRTQTGLLEYHHARMADVPPRAMALSPDGSLLASPWLESIWRGHDIRIWDTRTSLPLKQWPDDTRYLAQSVSFSPVGDDLAVAGGNEPSFILRGSQRRIEHLGRSKEDSSVTECESIRYSNDAKYLAIVCAQRVQIWERQTMGTESAHSNPFKLKSALLVPDNATRPTEVSFSNDTKKIVALDAGVTAWDLESEEEIWRINASDLKPLELRVEIFGAGSSIRSYPSNIWDFALDSAGMLYLATDSGIYVFNTNELE